MLVPVLISVGVVLILAHALYAGLLYGVARFSASPFRVPQWVSPGSFGFNQENVEFSSSDGVLLRAWWSEGRDDLVLIFAHGYLMNRSEYVPLLPAFSKAPSALFFDFRAHGQSRGNKCTFGPEEAKDVKAAYDFVRSRCPDARVLIVGSSMGAAATVLAVSEHSLKVDGLVLDGVYSRLDEAAKNWWSFIAQGKASGFLKPTWIFGRWVTGVDPSKVDMAEHFPRLNGTKILFLNGGIDPLVPRASAERNLTAAGSTAEAIWFEESSHGQARLDEPARYRQVLNDFISRF